MVAVDFSLSTNEKLKDIWSKVYLINALLLFDTLLKEVEKEDWLFLVFISSGALLISPDKMSLPG